MDQLFHGKSYHIQNDDIEVNDFFVTNTQENVIKGKIMGEMSLEKVVASL